MCFRQALRACQESTRLPPGAPTAGTAPPGAGCGERCLPAPDKEPQRGPVGLGAMRLPDSASLPLSAPWPQGGALVTALRLSRHLRADPASFPEGALCVRSTHLLGSCLSAAQVRRIMRPSGNTGSPASAAPAAAQASRAPCPGPRQGQGPPCGMKPLFSAGARGAPETAPPAPFDLLSPHNYARSVFALLRAVEQGLDKMSGLRYACPR